MKHNPGRLYFENNLVIRWVTPNHTILSQGKRLPKNCPLSKSVIKAYVKGGRIEAIKQMRQIDPQASFADLVQRFDEVAGVNRVNLHIRKW